MYGMHGAMAYAHFLASRYDMASACAEKAMRDHRTFMLPICISAASNALAGQLEPAQNAVARVLELNPNLRVSNLRDLAPFRRVGGLRRVRQGSPQSRPSGVRFARLGCSLNETDGPTHDTGVWELGHPLQKWVFLAASAFHLIATQSQTRRHVV